MPPDLDGQVSVGTSVRVSLHGRRVSGWVVADRVTPPPGVRLLPLLSVRGAGPAPELVELSEWAAHRWAGTRSVVLGATMPPRLVRALPPPGRLPSKPPDAPADGPGAEVWKAAAAGLESPQTLLRPPPAAPLWPAVAAAATRLAHRQSALVLAPSVAAARRLADRLAGAGWPVALVPDQWAEAAAGGRIVVGARAAAWAPAPRLGAAVVLDGHDEVYKEERVPTWSAWEVVAERARRAGAPCLITSPCPTLDLLAWSEPTNLSRSTERGGWPTVEVVDRTGDDPRAGLFSTRIVDLVRDEGATPAHPVVCVLNRKGRARLLSCSACGAVARCELCAAALVQARGEGSLRCTGCGLTRPPTCAACGSVRLSVLRPGVTRVGEELSALAGRLVAEVSADGETGLGQAAVVVGTEAVLHRLERAAAVAFLEFDQELTAPRFRAAEQALALLARAGRLVGGRPGRVLVQTRLADHEVLNAAVNADPGRLACAEAGRRQALKLPPYAAIAVLSGPCAGELAQSLRAGGQVEVAEVGTEQWVRAGDRQTLADALAAAGRPAARVRVDVDPLRA